MNPPNTTPDTPETGIDSMSVPAWLGLCLGLALAGIAVAQVLPLAAGPMRWLGPTLGIALAAGVRVTPRLWPGFALAAAVLAWAAGLDGPALLAVGVATSLCAWLAMRTLRRANLEPHLRQPRDIAYWLAAAAGTGLVLGTLAAMLARDAAPTHDGWLALSWNNAIGVLLTGTPLLGWRAETWRSLWRPETRAAVVGLPATALACALLAPAAPLHMLALLPPILLCLLARHGGLAPASALAAVLAVVAVVGAQLGAGPWAGAAGAPLLHAYIAALALAPLLMSLPLAPQAAHAGRWQQVLAQGQIGLFDWAWPAGGGFTSALWQSVLGTAQPTLAQWLGRVHEDDAAKLRSALDSLAHSGNAFRVELRMCLPQGGWRWFECQVLVPQRQRASGEPERIIGVLVDIHEQQTAQEGHRLSASLFQHIHEGLLITDEQCRVLDLNPAYSQITGASRQELLGTVPGLLQPAEPGTPAHQQQTAMWASVRAIGTWRGEVVERRRNGTRCTLQVTISSVLGTAEGVRFYVLVISDMTEQRLQRERLERQVHFDALTRLPNRTRVTHMLSEAMLACERDHYLLAVCYLDLDHFKPVNVRFGHAAGDRLLVEFAQRLRNVATWSDSVARLGGDEFVLLLRGATVEECRLAVERVLSTIAQPYLVEPGSEPVHITASLGATVFPLDHSDADTLLRHADHAMYSAKQSGRNGYLFFDPEHSRRTEARVVAIGRVQQALEKNELRLYYQPKVDMRANKVLGFEALLRWFHPEHGMISPAQFLPLIEHTGLSARVGDWVLEQALHQLAQWKALGLDVSISVNVSARHLQEPNFAQRLSELIAQHEAGLAHKLELEVLESAALTDVDHTSALIEHCQRLGIRFALDDFGTGYSTLTYLKRLPVDVLKIDRSFVHTMLADAQDLAIVEGVISLARTFNCTVVAEGVETPAQARMLLDMGCDIGQGMGISAPRPADEVPDWVREYKGIFALTAAASSADEASAQEPPAAKA